MNSRQRWLLLPLLAMLLFGGGCSTFESTPDYEGDDPGECSDDVDNDRDLLFDCDDPGCANSKVCKGAIPNDTHLPDDATTLPEVTGDSHDLPSDCLTEATYFQCAIWEPFMGSTCLGCHKPGGVGAASGEFELLPTELGDLSDNLERVRKFAQKQQNGKSVLLQKAGGALSHGGGVILPPDSAEYMNLLNLVSYFSDPGFCRTSCDPTFELLSEPEEICDSPPVTEKFDATQPIAAPAIHTQRLTQWQYRGAVSHTLGWYYNLFTDWLPTDSSTGTIPSNESYDLPTAEYARYAKTAAFVAAQIMAQEQTKLDALFACTDGNNHSCAKTFITERGKRIFRRPLTDEEINAYLEIYDIGAEGSFKEGMQYVIEALLQSPDFLYQIEIGPVDSAQETRLSGLEIATRLSFFLHQQPPSLALLDAAIAGELDEDSGVSEWVDTLLADVGQARWGIQQFILRWLRMDDEHAVEKDPELYPEFTAEVLHGIRRSVQLWSAYTVLEGDGQLETLFSAAETVIRLNGPENLFWNATKDDVIATSNKLGTIVSLPQEQHAGVLTSPARLANAHHSDATGTRPILRGAALFKNVLCGTLEPPQAFEPPPPIEGKSVKDSTSYMLDTPSCKGCHSIINSLGLAFEIYDGVGAYRADKLDDLGFPIETNGSYGIDGVCSENKEPFSDGIELIRSLATHAHLRSCATIQWFRYGLRRGPRLDGSDAGNLAQIYDSFETSNFNIRTLLKTIVLSRPFLYRRFGELGESP